MTDRELITLAATPSVEEDALSVAVGSACYWRDAGPSPLPDSFVVVWGIGRHPCDGRRPYLVGIDFQKDDDGVR